MTDPPITELTATGGAKERLETRYDSGVKAKASDLRANGWAVESKLVIVGAEIVIRPHPCSYGRMPRDAAIAKMRTYGRALVACQPTLESHLGGATAPEHDDATPGKDDTATAREQATTAHLDASGFVVPDAEPAESEEDDDPVDDLKDRQYKDSDDDPEIMDF